MSNKKSIAIPSDANLASFRNTEGIDDGSEDIISEVIATLSCRIASVVRVQLCTPA